jgi:hypothetical protein
MDVVDHVVGRVLDLFDVEHDLVRRWTGPPSRQPTAAGIGPGDLLPGDS